MIDNFREIFYWDSILIIIDRIGAGALAGIIAAFAVTAFLEWKTGLIARQNQPAPVLFKAFLLAGIYLVFIIMPVNTYDDLLYMFRSAYRYHFKSPDYKTDYIKGSYPLIKVSADNSNNVKPAEKPNVFIIFVESFNGFYPEAKNEKGEEYTPFFNSLIQLGLYVEQFYGNSIQTSKGHFASLFSIIPSIHGKVYTDFPKTRFNSLPKILAGNGYQTVMFQAYKEINFDNTGSFLRANGFGDVHSVAEFMQPGDEKNVWGWGLQDDVFYKKFFSFLDDKHKKSPEPFFSAVATISSHGDFDNVPGQLRVLYPDPQTPQENYANAIHAADSFLKTFFDELDSRDYLKNSIVIITADHSVPVGRHGFFCTETAAYEEFFRTPFLLLWKDSERIKPGRIGNAAFSQIDIAPTIIDLLGIKPRRSHFEGRSILAEPLENKPVYLVQPYNGIYISVVKPPFKYMRRLSTGEEFLYNISLDAMETNNLAGKPEFSKYSDELSESLSFVFLNQKLIENNEIWKEDTESVPNKP